MASGAVISDFVDCYSVDKIILEEEAAVSQYVHLCTASHDINSPDRRLLHEPTNLCRGSWVFSGAFIGPGVEIGERAVFAARSVVVKSVKAGQVVGGNPAKFLKRRDISWSLDSVGRLNAKVWHGITSTRGL